MLSAIMVVIYVQKSWIDEIGEMAQHLHFRNESATCVSLLGGESTGPHYPFVQTKLLANLRDDNVGKAFIPAHIPSSVIVGMFDLTETEAKAYGFHPATKK